MTAKLKPVDTHAHIQHERYKNREQVIQDTIKKTEFTIISGANREWNREAIKIASKHSNLYATIGLHPLDAQKLSADEFKKELKYIEDNKDNIVGVGEVGLDHHWEKDEDMRTLQKERFIMFIELANKLNKPLVIHSWDAEPDAIEILKKHAKTSVIMHCFSGKRETLEKCLDLGYYISISTMILMSKNTKKIAKNTPIEKMLLETDAPYLDPDHDINYPWKTELSAKKIADIKDITTEEVIRQTTKNAREVFEIR